MKQPYTIYLDSVHWSCSPNLISCSRLYRFLIQNNHKIVTDPLKADYIIISTCGVLKDLEDKSINYYNKYYSLKKKSTNIILYGCLIKTNWDRLKNLDMIPIGIYEDYKLNDLFYTKVKFEDIKPYCEEKTKHEIIGNKQTHIALKSYYFIATRMILPFSKKLRKKYNQIISDITQKNRIFVEISRGCTGNCSYCVIKKAKGKLCSRSIKDILNDIESIYDPSKTLFLVADDCGCYGADIDSNLIELITQINNKFPKITIDLDDLNPRTIQENSEEYIQLFKQNSFKYLIITLQSASNKILKEMNRNYDPKKIIEVTNEIKKVSPSSIINAHFIVGYPGETIIDFIKSLGASIHFDIPLPFKYTAMKGSTIAAVNYNKRNIIGSIRWFIFLLMTNIVILSKVLSYKLDLEKKMTGEDFVK